MKNAKLHSGLLLIILLLLFSLVGVTMAKYISTKQTGGTATFKTKLAAEFYVQQSLKNVNADGTYGSNDTKTQDNQDYVLIPGVDIPMTAEVVIKGKTKVPAHLYIQITDTTDEGNNVKLVSYELADHWKDEGSGKYVYIDSDDNPVELVGPSEELVISIFKSAQLTVSQYVKSYDTADSDLLEISATLTEVQP